MIHFCINSGRNMLLFSNISNNPRPHTKWSICNKTLCMFYYFFWYNQTESNTKIEYISHLIIRDVTCILNGLNTRRMQAVPCGEIQSELTGSYAVR